jgi:hypothetical protein
VIQIVPGPDTEFALHFVRFDSKSIRKRKGRINKKVGGKLMSRVVFEENGKGQGGLKKLPRIGDKGKEVGKIKKAP